MKIALAQLNPTVGDLDGNAELVRKAADQAESAGADILVATELVISGYPPKDLLLREGYAAACDRKVEELAQTIDPRLGVVVGHPSSAALTSGRIANAASLLYDGKVIETVHKSLLPNYDVFDEQRYFRPADRVQPVEFRGVQLGIHICEDAWYGQPSTFYTAWADGGSSPISSRKRLL